MSPFDLWPLALLSITTFLAVLTENRQRPWFESFLYCFFFGLGQYAVGASWLYESVHVFGGASVALAILMVGAFVLFYAVGFALFMSLSWFFSVSTVNRHMQLGLAVLLWVYWEVILLEDAFVISFPWLLVGYAFIDTWLAYFAPVGSVLLVSFMALVSCAALTYVRSSIYGVAVFAVIWVAGWGLSTVEWTRPAEEISVALVQGNVSLSEKWAEDGFRHAWQLHTTLTVEHAQDADVVVWPESALPVYDDQVRSHLRLFANEIEGTLIAGLFSRDRVRDEKYNSMIAVGNDPVRMALHYKNKLVPFGEYLPLGFISEPIARYLQMPMADLSPGPRNRDKHGRTFHTPAGPIGAYICYEIAYPNIVRQVDFNAGATFLLNMSEDDWFGTSLGPSQHMQIARMRALETGRYLVRATSTGITAIVNPRGEIEAKLDQGEQGVLRSNISKMEGMTWSNHLLILQRMEVLWFLSVIFGLIGWRQHRDAKELGEPPNPSDGEVTDQS